MTTPAHPLTGLGFEPDQASQHPLASLGFQPAAAQPTGMAAIPPDILDPEALKSRFRLPSIQAFKEGQVKRGIHESVSELSNVAAGAALPFLTPAALPAVGAAVGTGYAIGKTGREVSEAMGASPDTANLVEDVGNLAGGIVGGRYIPRAVGALTASEQGALNLFKRAVKPSGMTAADEAVLEQDFTRAVKHIGPQMTGVKLQSDKGLLNAAQVADDAAERLWSRQVEPVETRYGQVQSSGKPAADAVRGSFTDADLATRPAVVRAGNRLADFLDRPMTVKDQMDLVREWNNDKAVSRFYQMTPAEQRAAELGDPSLRSKVIALNATRANLFATVERTGGQELGDAFREGRLDWGALKSTAANLRDARVPAPTGPVDKAGQILRMLWSPKAWGDVLESSNPNRLAARSFNMTGRLGLTEPPIVPVPSPFASASRQLGPGALTTPPPVDTSGSVPFTPPDFSPTTRAQRLGLLLNPAPPPPMITPTPDYTVPPHGTPLSTPPPYAPTAYPLATIPGQGPTMRSIPSESPTYPSPNPRIMSVVNGEFERVGIGRPANLSARQAVALDTAIKGPRYKSMALDERRDYLLSLLRKGQLTPPGSQ